jgi:uncharacterized protein YbcI
MSSTPDHTNGGPSGPTGSAGSQISNAVVRLVREYTGRGPTKARTYFNDDLISVVLHDTLTVGERSLVRDGESERVLDTRKAYQQTMRTDLVAAVESASGRTVRAFFSDNSIDPDMAVETFVLDPRA